MVSVANRRYPHSPFQPEPAPPMEQYAVGDRVTHDRHGLGLVTGIQGEVAVYVDFGSGVRRLPRPTPKLHAL